MTGKLRVGVLGAGRGASVGHLFHLHSDAEVVAICDLVPERGEVARKLLPNMEATYTDFSAMLEHPGLDTVLIANAPHEHVPFVIQALEAGKNVFSEVVACATMAEAVQLVRAVEKAKGIYGFAQNTCFYRTVQEMKRLFDAGELGDFLYGEAEYMHEATIVAYRRSHLDGIEKSHHGGGYYCTHALGPMIYMTGTRPVRVTGFSTPNKVARTIGGKGDDIYNFVCTMSNGALVKILGGHGIKRQPIMHWYSAYGTRGQAENERNPNEDYLHLYLEHAEHSHYPVRYMPKFPYVLPWLPGSDAYHGGADAYCVDAYVRAVLAGGPAPFDVYKALDFTVPGIQALRSAWEGNTPMEVPDFHDEAMRKKYENDEWTAPRPSIFEDVTITAEVLEERRRRTEEAFRQGLIS